MSCFSKILENDKEYQGLTKAISAYGNPVGAIGLPEINKVLTVHCVCESLNKKAFIITPDEASAIKVYEDLSAITDGVLLYPKREFTFLDVEGISREFEHIRLGVLSKIIKNNYKIVVASVQAACQLTMPPDALTQCSFSICEGDELDIDETVERLIKAGYTRFDQVDGTSQFSIRGGLVDIFPPGADDPVRIELWGDTVDSIAKFDISTQRRNDIIDRIDIIPATEVLFPSKEIQAKKIDELASTLKGKAIKARERLYADSDRLKQGLSLHCNDRYLPLAYKSNGLFDYINDLLFVFESGKCKERFQNQSKLLLEDLKWLLEDGIICKGLDRFILTFDELIEKYKAYNAIYLDSFPRGSFDTPVGHLASFTCQTFNSWSGTLSQLKDELFPLIKTKYAVCILAGTSKSAKTLCYDLQELGYQAIYCDKSPVEMKHGLIYVMAGTTSAGFQLPSCKLALITYAKVNQAKKKHKHFSSKDAVHSLDELVVGDYIVHNIHGIGIFQGIEALEINNVSKDYIKISYAKGDNLYVPVTQLDLVSKYIGPRDDAKVKISRLGSGDWSKTKSKVRAGLQDMAKELIALYSKRMNTKGFAFSEDTDMQRDFELRFAYEETDDQLRAIDEIKGDMEKSAPMDRLLCGDVGFGKTEVALRAAFKCIGDGKQCAILVPTTVLAMQHFQTALKRMEAFPVRIEMLSRFVSPTKQKEILKDLEKGRVDLLIGTHRIFGTDIRFRDLGLLIVDEEQRFGVAQKEKIKEKFPKVDVLTLSATPIPRTLNMAMSGIRDMSLLEEAPGDRKPVQTYVMEYDMGILVEAMDKEIARGGQCYYLHNDIETIDHIAMQIKKALPHATVGVAHGQMTEEQLSNVWQKLLDAEIDVLVCTTIIETGVDVPNVNTLIIENANKLGLAQLHQIRGRVGRSSRRAYAYFTFTKGKELTDIAQKRLEAIREYTEFGSGFKIAMRDLEIRGAGSLLGNRQHGHMESVGYDMYIKLLEQAISEEKGEYVPDEREQECLIDLPVDASIPKSYISSTPQRLDMYKSIANIRSNEEANEVYDELTDRFGVPPASVYGLVEIALLRNLAQSLGIYEIRQTGVTARFFLNDVKPEYLLALHEKMRGRAKLNSGKKTFISVETVGGDTMGCVRDTLNLLYDSVKNE
ncbi:transcription-repair coupling factor [Eubacterium sp.]|uniref:transcription-repair coupling factor n=1 Tax=Eubacterium sp. TaxID=142586 RepID=UPI003F090592